MRPSWITHRLAPSSLRSSKPLTNSVATPRKRLSHKPDTTPSLNGVTAWRNLRDGSVALSRGHSLVSRVDRSLITGSPTVNFTPMWAAPELGHQSLRGRRLPLRWADRCDQSSAAPSPWVGGLRIGHEAAERVKIRIRQRVSACTAGPRGQVGGESGQQTRSGQERRHRALAPPARRPSCREQRLPAELKDVVSSESTSATPRTLSQIAASCCSTFMEASLTAACRGVTTGGGGSAERSSFPLTFSGRASILSRIVGTM